MSGALSLPDDTDDTGDTGDLGGAPSDGLLSLYSTDTPPADGTQVSPGAVDSDQPGFLAKLGLALAGGSAGIDDLSAKQKQDVGSRSLMNFGLALLQGGGPSYTPRNFGQILASGLGAAEETETAGEQGAAVRQQAAAEYGLQAQQLLAQQMDAKIKLAQFRLALAKLGGPGATAAALGIGGAPGAGPSGAAPGTGTPGTGTPGTGTPGTGDYAGSILQLEGGPSKNPLSNAAGYGQFTPDTWGDFAKANPALFANMTPQQVLDARNDPGFGSVATTWLAQRNATALRAAGVTPSGPSLGIAHFLGAAPAAAVMNAPDDAMVGDVLTGVLGKDQAGEVLKANPQLATATAGSLRARYAGVPDPGFLGATAPSGGQPSGGPGTGRPVLVAGPGAGPAGSGPSGGRVLPLPPTPPAALGPVIESGPGGAVVPGGAPAGAGQQATPPSAGAPSAGQVTPPALDPDPDIAAHQMSADRLLAGIQGRLQPALDANTAAYNAQLGQLGGQYRTMIGAAQKGGDVDLMQKLEQEWQTKQADATAAYQQQAAGIRTANQTEIQQATQAAQAQEATIRQAKLQQQIDQAKAAQANQFELGKNANSAVIANNQDRLKAYNTAGNAAQTLKNTLDLMELVLPSAGPADIIAQEHPEWRDTLRSVAGLLGIDPAATDRWTAQDVTDQLGNLATLEAKPVGFSRPSNLDVSLLTTARPRLGQSPQAREIGLAMLKTQAQMTIDQQLAANKSFNGNPATGTLDDDVNKATGTTSRLPSPPALSAPAVIKGGGSADAIAQAKAQDAQAMQGYMGSIQPGTVFRTYGQKTVNGQPQRVMTWGYRRPDGGFVINPLGGS